jgi:GAF domain-containing protein/DNA-binding CsgD family transcriptional regulator
MMYGNLTQTGVFKLFHQITHAIRRSPNSQLMLKDAVQTIGWGLELDRCVVMLSDPEQQEIEVRAEYSREPWNPLGSRRYQLWTNSEWYRLLNEGRPVPLKEIRLEGGNPSATPELDQFIFDSDSQSLVAFPMVYENRLVGCLTMHYCKEAKSFSDEILELGEAIADELAAVVNQAKILKEKDFEGRVFRESAVPFLVVDFDSFRILQANRACCEMLAAGRKDLRDVPIVEFVAESDARRIAHAAGELDSDAPMAMVKGIVARGASGAPVSIDAAVSPFAHDGKMAALVTFMPDSSNANGNPTASGSAGSGEQVAKLEELVSAMSRQLNWERLARHIVSSIHTTLDRDSVLQTTADSLARALTASRCLIVRTDGPVSPMVTHEYVEPDISPLGLGRTSQFPLSAISCFKNKSAAIRDLNADPPPPGLSREDLEDLLENNVRAMMGTPIAHHGTVHGVVIVVQTGRPRQWSNQETELLETVAEQAAIALSHAQRYAQTKDQLFNMNLIGNLTQQLTTALDMATRAGKPETPPETIKQPGPSTPLSLRELEVLKLIASGLANREIAQRLFLTESTVELHASRIRKKLKLKSRTALVKYACDNHLV